MIRTPHLHLYQGECPNSVLLVATWTRGSETKDQDIGLLYFSHSQKILYTLGSHVILRPNLLHVRIM